MAMKNEIWVFAGLVVLAIWAFGGNLPFLGSTGGTATGGDGTINVEVSQPDKACGSTTMTVDFTKKYAASTTMTAYNATVYINGNEKGIVSEGSTFTAQGGDELNVYYSLDPANNDYYASHAYGKIPCTGQTAAFTTSNILGKGTLAGALQTPPDELYYSSTAASISVLDAEDYSALPIPIGTGGTEAALVTIGWAYEEGYGVADGNTLACRITAGDFDEGDFVVSLDGQTLSPAKYVPSSTRFAVSATNQTLRYWAIPAIDGAQTAQSVMRFQVKADSNKNPTADANVSCEILDTDLFQTDNGNVMVGVEDSDNNANVGRSTEQVF